MTHLRPNTRRGFTLVELLVVIGIIALLISILLPSLNKARQQAAVVTCSSTMRQFYNCWLMYANENRGKSLPARYQIHTDSVNAEFGFFEGQFLGKILGANSGGGSSAGTTRSADTAAVIKALLQCKAVNHDSDPNPDASQEGKPTAYYGDYLYNSWMGTRKALPDTTDTTDPNGSYPSLPISRIPGNVVILMESFKPNVVQDATGKWIANTVPSTAAAYKYYFEKNNEIFSTTMTAGQPASALKLHRIGTPHMKNSKMNTLSADGHVAFVDPFTDFFRDKSNQSTIREYLWDAKDKYPAPPAQQTNSHPGWNKGLNGL